LEEDGLTHSLVEILAKSEFGSIASELRSMSALPPIATKLVRRNEVTLCAMSGCEQSQQGSPYSITSSAYASSVAASSSRW